MKIFTKSLLTLALLCVAGVANADRSWSKVAIKGYVHEYRDGSTTSTDAEALTDEEGAFKVYCATPAELGKESVDDWDSQFFIQWAADKALFEGDKVKVKMQVKADIEASGIGTQAHNNHGNYNWWDCIGSVNFTTEWTEFTAEKEVSTNMGVGQDGDKPGFYSIAFNLSNKCESSNYYYFKDIEVEIFNEKGVTRTVVSDKVILGTSWISNGDIENENLASFPVSKNGGKTVAGGYPEEEKDLGTAAFFPEIVEGEDINGNMSHYLKVTNDENPATTWGTQFFFLANEVLPKGTAWVLEMDIKADNEDASVSTGYHADPRSWRSAPAFDAFTPTTEWQHLKFTGTIPSTDADDIQSIALDLNNTADGSAGNDGCSFYIDNIQFGAPLKVEKLTNNFEVVRVLFTDYTNMPDLIQANVGNKARQELPEDQWSNFVVTIDGAAATISSVEYDQEGQLYIFLEDEMTEDSKVKVKFTNPSDAKFRLVYTNGDKKGEAVEGFEWESEYDEEALDGVEPFAFSEPGIASSEPEDGSFGLENNLTEFTVVFDKKVLCNKVEAKFDGERATVTYDDAEGTTIKVTRNGTAALADGEHTISLSKVYAATNVQLTGDGSNFELTFSVGAKGMPQEVADAIAAAQSELEESADERYDGEAKTALTEAVAKYEAEGATYTAPSQVNAAVNDLSQKASALSKHRTNCNKFDENMQSAEGILADNAAFSAHELYQALKAAYDKYAEMGTVTDDAVLLEAIAALDANVAAGKQMFTTGESKINTTGIAALVERIRLGKEALLALGVAEDDELIVAADKALTDDDDLAKKIQDHLSLKVCEALKDGVDLFASEEFDEGSGDFIPAKVDMSVFIKNPNIYKLGSGKMDLASVPGWTYPTENKPEVFNSWGSLANVEGLPVDAGFTKWRPNVMRMEQTIENLPAGLYTVEMLASDWAHHNEGQTFAYAITYSGANAAQAPAEGAEPDMEQNYSAVKLLEKATDPNEYAIDKAHDCEPVEVIDGKLTIGVQFGQYPGALFIQELFPDENLSTQDASTQYVVEAARVYLTGAIEGHDYAADYEQIKTGVNTAKTVKVRAIELYDLNGRRISKATKGLNIIKRQMSDGSVKTDKVVK